MAYFCYLLELFYSTELVARERKKKKSITEEHPETTCSQSTSWGPPSARENLFDRMWEITSLNIMVSHACLSPFLIPITLGVVTSSLRELTERIFTSIICMKPAVYERHNTQENYTARQHLQHYSYKMSSLLDTWTIHFVCVSYLHW